MVVSHPGVGLSLWQVNYGGRDPRMSAGRDATAVGSYLAALAPPLSSQSSLLADKTTALLNDMLSWYLVSAFRKDRHVFVPSLV